jgi:hypothetical protein
MLAKIGREKQTSYIVGGNVNLFNSYGKNYGGSSKNKNRLAL